MKFKQMDPVLELRNVSKQFPNHRALDGIHLTIRRGEFFSLLGPSGCGKTTTLRIIAGFETPTTGQVLLNGVDIAPLPPYERNVSTVFQSYALFPHLSVRANIEFGLKQNRIAAPEANARVEEALDLLELAGKESRMPHQLSGGERQRVALARSLVLRPEVLLLDEPLSALDPNLRASVRRELKMLQQKLGITFVFVTHDQEEAMALSHRMAVFQKGRIQQVGTPQEVYFQPTTRFVAGFLGDVNWINGMGLRPELTRLARSKPNGETRSLPGVVRNATFLGNLQHIETQLESGEHIVAEVTHRDEAAYQVGEPVHVWWHPKDELQLPREA